VADDSRIDLVGCDSLLSNSRQRGRVHTFELTNDGRLVTSESGYCLTVTSSFYVISQPCNATQDMHQVVLQRRNFNPVHCQSAPAENSGAQAERGDRG